MFQTPIQPEIPTTVEEEKKKKSVLFYINIFLLLAVLGLGAYILVKEGFWIKKQNHEMKETEEATEKKKSDGSIVVEVKETKDTDFTGEFVKAQLPEGWSIKEYKDGDGTKLMVDDSNPKGLTGLEVKKGETVMFKLEGLDGYGSNYCGELAHFKDLGKEYEDEIRTQNEEAGVETKILDYTSTPYTETNLFGIKTRRVEKTLYYDTIEEGGYFEPQCVKNVLIFKDLKFAVGKAPNQTEKGDYQYTLSEGVNEENLVMLDEILKSMKVI